MTPAQEAKEYAATHGFVISTLASIRKLRVYHVNHNGGRMGEHIAEVSGYPAALNAMKREMETLREQATTSVSADHEFGTVQTPLRTDHVSIDDAAKRTGVAAGVITQMIQSESHGLRKPIHQIGVFSPAAEYRARGPWCAEIEYLDGETEGECFATRSEAVTDIRRAMNIRTLRPHIKTVNIVFRREYVR